MSKKVEVLNNSERLHDRLTNVRDNCSVVFLFSYSIRDEYSYTVDTFVDDYGIATNSGWRPAVYIRYNQGSQSRALITDTRDFDGDSYSPIGLRLARDYVLEHWWPLLLSFETKSLAS